MRCAARRGLALAAACTLALLAGCATGPRYTSDDGRRLDDKVIAPIRQHVAGERALRPAILRSAALKDPDCSTQWELPFTLASSRGWSEDERVAWVRVAGVDERLTVVAVAEGSPLAPGERITRAGRIVDPEDIEAMTAALAWLRDEGEPFTLRTDRQPEVTVTPVQVCRGMARFAPPNTPQAQDYHWLMTMHPLEVAAAQLTADEALWVVLWSQGLSEEGGFRMKAYDYTTSTVSTLFSLASLASGLKGAAVAAEAAMSAARTAAAGVVSDLVKQQLIEQAKAFAEMKLRESLVDAVEKLSQQQMLSAMQRLAMHRGTLLGVARVAATVFDRADAWAFERARRLGADPLAGLRLHHKLIRGGATGNALAFDAERLAAIARIVDAAGLREAMLAILHGVRPEALETASLAMPLASAQTRFAYVESDAAPAGLYSQGLINAMLQMPLRSEPSR